MLCLRVKGLGLYGIFYPKNHWKQEWTWAHRVCSLALEEGIHFHVVFWDHWELRNSKWKWRQILRKWRIWSDSPQVISVLAFKYKAKKFSEKQWSARSTIRKALIFNWRLAVIAIGRFSVCLSEHCKCSLISHAPSIKSLTHYSLSRSGYRSSMLSSVIQ